MQRACEKLSLQSRWLFCSCPDGNYGFVTLVSLRYQTKTNANLCTRTEPEVSRLASSSWQWQTHAHAGVRRGVTSYFFSPCTQSGTCGGALLLYPYGSEPSLMSLKLLERNLGEPSFTNGAVPHSVHMLRLVWWKWLRLQHVPGA